MSLAQAQVDKNRADAATALEQDHGNGSGAADELPLFASPAQVSTFTGIPVQTLAYWRFAGSNLPFVKLGRLIRYRRQDVMRFLNSHVFNSTAEAKAAR